MTVPWAQGRRFGTAAAAVLFFLSLSTPLIHSAAPKPRRPAPHQPQPFYKLSLEKLGFPGVSTQLLAAGASSLSVNFLDDTHLLVSFGLRGLVHRIAGDSPTDEDREVAIEIVDIPTGKVTARTQWHVHDHGRYLWPLGQGRFMVRIGGSLSILAPLANPAMPFQRISFPGRGLYPGGIFASPDGAILMVETELPPDKTPAVVTWADSFTPQADTMLDLYRVTGDGSAATPVTINETHAVRSAQPLVLPIDQDGYLWPTDEGTDPNHWIVSFHEFGGKKQVQPVGDMLSTCQPGLQLLSRSEYLAITCSPFTDGRKMFTYGFDGHENWEESIGTSTALSFTLAPSAGRFAMSRISTSPGPIDPASQIAGQGEQHQEMRVYQTESGDLLLRTELSPLIKAGQNFDLSPDGEVAAAIRGGEILIYHLPEPTAQDRKDMAEAATFAPPPGADSPITLEGIAVKPHPDEIVSAPRVDTPVSTTPATSAPASNTPSPALTNSAVPASTASADSALPKPATSPARKPPTLLLPGEQPEFKDKRQQQSPQ